MKIIISLENFDGWCGAENTLERISDNGLMDSFDALMEDIYPDGLDETELNDILRFEQDWCWESVGLSTEDSVNDEITECEEHIEEIEERMEEIHEELIDPENENDSEYLDDLRNECEDLIQEKEDVMEEIKEWNDELEEIQSYY